MIGRNQVIHAAGWRIAAARWIFAEHKRRTLASRWPCRWCRQLRPGHHPGRGHAGAGHPLSGNMQFAGLLQRRDRTELTTAVPSA